MKILNKNQFLKNYNLNTNLIFSNIENEVLKIINDIKNNGDDAIRFYAKKFDNIDLKDIKVNKTEIIQSENMVSNEFKKAISIAKNNIFEFHKNQIRKTWEIKNGSIILGQLIRPINRVALYIPGGKALYPSSILMNAIPAIVAGVKEIFILTPPDKFGNINPHLLHVAKLLGINEIYKVGGAGAIAVSAFGTKTIKRANKVVGPGNKYVIAAKKILFGIIGIDMIAGPSEILVISDNKSNSKFIASDLLAQAEHDEDAKIYLISTSTKTLKDTKEEIFKQIKSLNKKNIIEKVLNNNLYFILASNAKEMFELSNIIAPEHLEIFLENPESYLTLVENAGSIFLGEYTPEVLGDYIAGVNHTLPTNGTSKFSSPLSVDDFITKPSYLKYEKKDFINVADEIAQIASVENLNAHKNSALIRLK